MALVSFLRLSLISQFSIDVLVWTALRGRSVPKAMAVASLSVSFAPRTLLFEKDDALRTTNSHEQ